MGDKVFFKNPFILNYFLDRYKTQEWRDKAVDACMPALKFVPGWFVTKKKINDAVSFNDDIVFVNEDTGNVTFFSNEMGIVECKS